MKTRNFASILLSIVLLLFIRGNAEEKTYIYSHPVKSLIYPGETAGINLDLRFDSDSRKDMSKDVTISVYGMDPEDIFNGDRKRVLAQNPIRSLRRTITLPYRNSQWYQGGDKIELKKLPAGKFLIRATCDLEDSFSVLNVTAIGATAKADTERLVLFVQDNRDGDSVSNARITVYDPRTRFRKTIRTDDKGIGILYFYELKGYERGSLLQVTVQKDDDLCDLEITPDSSFNDFKGYIYTDRPIYRPARKVHIKGVLRNIKNGKYICTAGETYGLAVKDPKNRELFRADLKADKFGSIYNDFQLDSRAVPGDYTITVTSGKKSANTSFRVEEYRKPEIEITVKTEKTTYIQGDSIKARITAGYYFGAPVKDAPFTYQVWRESLYSPPGQDQYMEALPPMRRESIKNGEGRTDENGHALISIDTGKTDYDARYLIYVRMIDRSRRETSGSGQALVTRGAFFLSLNTDKYCYQKGGKAGIRISAQDYANKPVQTPLNLKIIKTVYSGNKRIDRILLEKTLRSNEKGMCRFDYKLTSVGYYSIQTTTTDKFGHSINAGISFFCSDSEYHQSWYNFSSIGMTADKSSYTPGQKAKIFITVPHRNPNVLITIEGDRIYDFNVVQLDGNTETLTIPVKKEYCPNFYVTISYFAKGVFHRQQLSVKATDPDKFMKLKINSDKKRYEPGETATLKLQTLAGNGKPIPAQITLGMVDESIYALVQGAETGIGEFFHGYREKRVSTSSSYSVESARDYTAEAVPESSPPSSNGESKPPDSVREYFPDTCYFNPNIITDKNGTAKVHIPLPDSLTTWRASAKAVTVSTRVGEGEKKVVCTKDLLARLILPRFLTEKDECTVSGIIHNYTDSTRKVVAELTVKGAVPVDGKVAEFELSPGEERRIDWQIRADKVGRASFFLRALTETESDAVRLEIPVQPHGTVKYSYRAGSTETSESVIVTLPEFANRDSASLLIQTAPSIASGIFPALKYLAGYPYGCVEQTMSRFLPTVLVSKTVADFSLFDAEFNRKLPDMVDKGLMRLYDFQHQDGGWGWWKNDKSHPFMTAYVLQGLIMAKSAGYRIKDDVIKSCAGWLERNYDSQENTQARVYMLYALSLAGEVSKDRIIEIYGERNSMDSYSCALAALILQSSGMEDKALEMVTLLENTADVGEELCSWKPGQDDYGWTSNQVEITSCALMAMLRIKPDSPLIEKTVKYLVYSRRGNSWYSTKDTACAIMALCEYMKKTGETGADYSGSVTVNGRMAGEFRFTGILPPAVTTAPDENGTAEQKQPPAPSGIKPFEVTIPADYLIPGRNTIAFSKTGVGKLYYTANLTYYTREEKIRAESSGIAVKREYFAVKEDLRGKETLLPLKGQEVGVFTQDRIRVKITITANGAYDYAVLEDPKPAGFELADNTEDSSSRWNHWYAQREVYDDRTVFFMTHLQAQEAVLEYTLRAETPGTFHTMPARASLMYIPEIGGISDEVIFTVSENDNLDGRKLGTFEEMRLGFWNRLYSFFE